MLKKKKSAQETRRRPSWRDYQAQLRQRPRRIGINRKTVISCGFFAAVIVTFCIGLFPTASPMVSEKTTATEVSVRETTAISKKDVQLLLENTPLDNLTTKQLSLPIKGSRFQIETSLDTQLQEALISGLDKKNSRYIGIVVMDADSGRILAMAGFDKTDSGTNPCLRGAFPAASIFKMVTAAAAVDHCGYNAATKVHYNGYQHTLYKRQLKNDVNRYTHTVTLEKSFARSVNPVFGKLGALTIGKTILEQYGAAFGFNQPINFELPVIPSHLHIDPEPYHLAEIASGFNTDTTLSPLHAAMIASSVLNGGRMKAPTIVETISDEKGRIVYQSKQAWHGRAMTTRAAGTLARMMEATVASGTARKVFHGYRQDQILSQLKIGGKTGSIFNRSHDARFDWFVGFAEDKKGAGRIALAALVAHEEYIGIRAGQYARKAMVRYFEKNPATAGKKTTRANS